MRNLAGFFLFLLLFFIFACPGGKNPAKKPVSYNALVTDPAQNRVYVISILKGEIKDSFPLSGGAGGMGAYSPEKELYFLCNQTAKLLVFHHNKQLPPLETGANPFSLELSPDGRFLLVSNNEENTVSVFERGDSFQLKGKIQVGKSPGWIKAVFNSGRFLVSNNGENSISLVEAATLSELGRITVGYDPMEIELDEQRGEIYTACFSENVLVVNSLNDFKEKARIPLGEGPYGVAKAPGGQLFVTLSQEGSIALIDMDEKKEKLRKSLGGYPAEIELSPGGDFLLVLDRGNQKLLCLSTLDLEKIWELEFKGEPSGLLVTDLP